MRCESPRQRHARESDSEARRDQTRRDETYVDGTERKPRAAERGARETLTEIQSCRVSLEPWAP